MKRILRYVFVLGACIPNTVVPSILDSSNSFDEEVTCLAENIYFESRNESVMGQIAVAYVTLNRVFDKTHPDTICGVVRQGKHRESWKTKMTDDPDDAIFFPIKNKCQFSWYCDGKSDKILNLAAWKGAESVAAMVTVEYGSRRHNDPTSGALWYHADSVHSKFHSGREYTATIGAHIFYR
jgi:spore germination cell wall hydrolase CwlJ-like protein